MRKTCFILLGLIITIFQSTMYANCGTMPNNETSRLQFTSSGHALFFGNSSITVASPTHAMKVSFLHANRVSPQAEMPTTTEISEQKKITSLNKVTYANVWEGVTLVYTSKGNGIYESSYYLTPTRGGIDASRIRLGYNRSVSLDNAGNLVISFPNGTLTESAPAAWQIIQGTKKPVRVSYRLYGKNEVGFTLGKYVSGVPIMIDPTLSWNTFLGGSNSDFVKGVAIDKNGNIYVCGSSFATWGSPILPFAGSSDAFVAKLAPDGSILWNTFLGGTSAASGYCIAVGSNGVIYVGGTSNTSWGTNIIQPFGSSSLEGFIAKLTSNGSLLWNTFLGDGSAYNYLNNIVLDSKDTLFVTGYSTHPWGSPIATFTTATYNGYIAKLDSNGGLKWNTFFGPTADASNYAYSNTIAIDNQDTI